MATAEKNGVRYQHFSAYMNWFSVAEQPNDIDDLPEEFKQAYELWAEDPDKNMERVAELLSPYVKGLFILENIDGWEEIFADPDGGEFHVIAADSVEVVAVDFSNGRPIPCCVASACFSVPVLPGFSGEDLYEWQYSHVYFYEALCFMWDIPRSDNTEGLDFTYDGGFAEAWACPAE